MTRWFLALQDYNFQVVHRPGRTHANADALSRRDACLGLSRGVPDLQLRVGVCGNPDPTEEFEPRQRPLRGSPWEICAARRCDAGVRIECTRAITEMRRTRRRETAEGS